MHVGRLRSPKLSDATTTTSREINPRTIMTHTITDRTWHHRCQSSVSRATQKPTSWTSWSRFNAIRVKVSHSSSTRQRLVHFEDDPAGSDSEAGSGSWAQSETQFQGLISFTIRLNCREVTGPYWTENRGRGLFLGVGAGSPVHSFHAINQRCMRAAPEEQEKGVPGSQPGPKSGVNEWFLVADPQHPSRVAYNTHKVRCWLSFVLFVLDDGHHLKLIALLPKLLRLIESTSLIPTLIILLIIVVVFFVHYFA